MRLNELPASLSHSAPAGGQHAQKSEKLQRVSGFARHERGFGIQAGSGVSHRSAASAARTLQAVPGSRSAAVPGAAAGLQNRPGDSPADTLMSAQTTLLPATRPPQHHPDITNRKIAKRRISKRKTQNRIREVRGQSNRDQSRRGGRDRIP